MPILSVITVTYNAESFLERTIQSLIANQPDDTVEYLIIDGRSTDKTLEIIRKYEKHITRWISEPDRGLYDAMNKGQHLATGEYVWFLNAGDTIHAPDVLARLLPQLRTRAVDVCYSDALFVDPTGRALGLRSELTPHTLPNHLTWQDMALGMKVCHQAFIARRSLAPDYPIDNLSADVDWEIRCLKAARNVVRLSFILCNYLTGGLSVQRHRQSLLDRYKVLSDHFGTGPALWNHLRIVLRAIRFRFKRPSVSSF